MDGWMDEAYTIALGGRGEESKCHENKSQVHNIPIPFLSRVIRG